MSPWHAYRAIAEVFSSFDAAGRLTNVRIDNKISKLIGYARLIKCKDDDFHS